MPLALDDAALARLAIAATRIAPTAREAWLMKFAERAEQPKILLRGRVLAPAPIVGSAAAAGGPPYAAAGTALHRRFTDAR
jgi:hypothetical protein